MLNSTDDEVCSYCINANFCPGLRSAEGSVTGSSQSSQPGIGSLTSTQRILDTPESVVGTAGHTKTLVVRDQCLRVFVRAYVLSSVKGKINITCNLRITMLCVIYIFRNNFV